MSVQRPRPSPEILGTLNDGLDPFLDDGDPLRNILTGSPTGSQLGESAALQVYTATLEDVSAGNWKNLKAKGWRFLAVDQNKSGIIVNVTGRPGQPARVGAVQRGSYVSKLLDAVRNVAVPPNVNPNDVELALLNIPALQTEAFWIKSKTGDGWVVPYKTLIEKLKTDSPMPLTLDQFFAAAKPEAERRKSQDDSLTESDVSDIASGHPAFRND